MSLPPTRAALFRILSDEYRIKIIEILATTSSDVSSLAKSLRIGQSLLSHHLGRMHKAGLLVRKRFGKNIEYRVNPDLVSGKSLNLGCCKITLH